MRILHLIHSEGVYGAETILLYLAREQQQRGHEPVIGSIRDPGTPETAFEALARIWGLSVAAIRIAPRPTPAVVRSLLNTVRAVAPDVLHSHGYKANILLGPVPRPRRGAMLATLHGWTSTRLFSRMWLYERLERLSLARLDAVVVVTRQMLSHTALRGVAPSRRHVIENGIPSRATRMADLERRGAPPLPPALLQFVLREPTLVAIGRLAAEKDFALLLDAFAQARQVLAGCQQLLIVGEGPQRDHLSRRVRSLGLQQVVMLGGYVDGADRLLEHAAGFVMSSRTEGLPLVLLEAMQWGVPILATAVGAIPELIAQGTGDQLVPPRDPAALAGGLQQLLLQPPRPAGSLAPALERYSSARMAEDYLGAYKAIA